MQKLLPYFKLVRLPNVFTAMADVALAALAAGAFPDHWLPFVLLLLASSCLYCSGMVWNDYFDVEQDTRERPFRPIPSGRVPLRTAFRLAFGLMALGVLLAAAADFRDGYQPFSTWLALALCAAILLYDGFLKKTWAGPVMMGACRSLNVLLGLTVVPHWVGPWGVLLALVVGVYIAGVTWFARTEARESNQAVLAGAAAVMLFAVLLALALPVTAPVPVDDETSLPTSTQVWLGQLLLPYLLAVFAGWVGLRVYPAIRRPAPEHVQKAVKRSIFGLVLLDAVLATAFVGPLGLLLLLLLIPATYLGRWIYST